MGESRADRGWDGGVEDPEGRAEEGSAGGREEVSGWRLGWHAVAAGQLKELDERLNEWPRHHQRVEMKVGRPPADDKSRNTSRPYHQERDK